MLASVMQKCVVFGHVPPLPVTEYIANYFATPPEDKAHDAVTFNIVACLNVDVSSSSMV